MPHCWAPTQEWERIPHEKLRELVSFLPKCLLSVIKRKGDVTKWQTCPFPTSTGQWACCSHEILSSLLFGKKTIKFISLNIKYVVFVVYSMEYRLKRIFKSLYFFVIYILHNFPTSTESGLYYRQCQTQPVKENRRLRL